MSVLIFVDTNVLVYERDSRFPEKADAAGLWMRELWDRGTGRTSVQVLVEYYSVSTRRLNPPLQRDIAQGDVRELATWDPVGYSPELFERAWNIEERYGLSWWDSLIVAAAQVAGCDALLTADLQAGQDFDGVRVVDPFVTSPAEAGL